MQVRILRGVPIEHVAVVQRTVQNATNVQTQVRFLPPQLANLRKDRVSFDARLLRDRLMERCDALNVETLVRFQLPQFEYGSHPAGSKARRRPIGRMKAWAAVDEHSLKTGGGCSSLVGSSPTPATNDRNSTSADSHCTSWFRPR